MNTTRSDASKTPVLVLGPGLMSRLIEQGLKNVRDFTKGNAFEKLLIALGEHPRTATVVVLPRESFEKNDLFRRALTRIKEEFPLSRILALRSGGVPDEVMITNDIKVGADDVLWHPGQVPGVADAARIANFVIRGALPKHPPATATQAPQMATPAKPTATQLLQTTPATTGKTLSTQELLHQVIAGQAVLQAQIEAIQRRLDQVHGIVSGKVMDEIKQQYPQILKVLNFPD